MQIVQDGPWHTHATPSEIAALYRAVMLAPTIHVAEALLRGENVPLNRLDPEWVKRLGLK